MCYKCFISVLYVCYKWLLVFCKCFVSGYKCLLSGYNMCIIGGYKCVISVISVL